MNSEILIESRFCGPPESGNGGYVCGRLAAYFDGPAEVTLWKPPPLETRMSVVAGDDGVVRLMHGEEKIAEAKSGKLDVTPPAPVSWEDATRAAENYVGFNAHPFPSCFVCGPQRAAGDGLRIFAGELEGEVSTVAAPWQPDESLAGDNGIVDPAYIFAALDCPGYFATNPDSLAAVLGRLTGKVDQPVRVGEKCVVMAWPLGRDGRKAFTASAVYREDGALAGLASATWIRLRI